jgi:hypothetical protein
MPEEFINKRTRVSLPDAKLLRRGDEKRHNFSLSINLSEGNAIVGMPAWIQDAYTHLSKSQSRTADAKFNVKLMNMTLDFFSTEMTGGAFFSVVTDATLTKFSMKRKGDGDEADVILSFTAYFPGRREIHDWTFDHKNADFWMEFEQQQGELNLSGDVTSTSESDDDEEEDDEGESDEDDDEDEDDATEDEDDLEAQRREACRPVHDAEFGISPAAREAKQVADAKAKLKLM